MGTCGLSGYTCDYVADRLAAVGEYLLPERLWYYTCGYVAVWLAADWLVDVVRR